MVIAIPIISRMMRKGWMAIRTYTSGLSIRPIKKSNRMANTQKERVKKNNNEYQFLFNQSFVDYFDNDSNSWKKCGFDNKGDIHIIDVISLKHKILNFKGTQ